MGTCICGLVVAVAHKDRVPGTGERVVDAEAVDRLHAVLRHVP